MEKDLIISKLITQLRRNEFGLSPITAHWVPYSPSLSTHDPMPLYGIRDTFS